MLKTGNLFGKLPDAGQGEASEVLAKAGGAEVERIVSRGRASPEGFWYEQDRGEWVVVLQGGAGLRFSDPAEVVEMTAGDWVWIEAGRRHRVEWTEEAVDTVWLAVFLPAAASTTSVAD